MDKKYYIVLVIVIIIYIKGYCDKNSKHITEHLPGGLSGQNYTLTLQIDKDQKRTESSKSLKNMWDNLESRYKCDGLKFNTTYHSKKANEQYPVIRIKDSRSVSAYSYKGDLTETALTNYILTKINYKQDGCNRSTS